MFIHLFLFFPTCQAIFFLWFFHSVFFLIFLFFLFPCIHYLTPTPLSCLLAPLFLFFFIYLVYFSIFILFSFLPVSPFALSSASTYFFPFTFFFSPVLSFLQSISFPRPFPSFSFFSLPFLILSFSYIFFFLFFTFDPTLIPARGNLKSHSLFQSVFISHHFEKPFLPLFQWNS